jgi:hypothetical protein
MLNYPTAVGFEFRNNEHFVPTLSRRANARERGSSAPEGNEAALAMEAPGPSFQVRMGFDMRKDLTRRRGHGPEPIFVQSIKVGHWASYATPAVLRIISQACRRPLELLRRSLPFEPDPTQLDL